MFPLGRQVKAIRALYKINQQDLADKIGVGRTYLSLFENGQATLNEGDIQKLLSTLKDMGVASRLVIELPASDPVAIAV